MKTRLETLADNSGASGNNSTRNTIANNLSTSAILREVPISLTDIDAEDVLFYAKLIGIDPFIEPYLLWIAQAGLVSPLPIGWTAVEDHKHRLYYYNWSTNKSAWEHPNDHHYQSLVKKYRKKAKYKGHSPSFLSLSQSTANQTTMSGLSSMGNLHFFDDDEDDFKDLLMPRLEQPKPGASLRTTLFHKESEIANKSSVSSKEPPTKEDSVESIDFELENSNELIEEGDSIASLEAYQTDNKINDLLNGLPIKETGENLTFKENEKDNGKDRKTLPHTSISGKENSDPESDHWNSLPDNEQLNHLEKDPFADIFQKDKSETSKQRPTSAKVRATPAEQSTDNLPKQNTILNNSNKKLSILEEEDDQIEENEYIDELYEDEKIVEVNEMEETPESIHMTTNGIVKNLDKQIHNGETGKGTGPEMSQMGRITTNVSAHLEQVHSVNKGRSVKINEPNLSAGPGVNGALNVPVETAKNHPSNMPVVFPPNLELYNKYSSEIYDEDFESESENLPDKANLKQIKEIEKKLEEQISKLREDLNLSLNISRNDLSKDFKHDLEILQRKIDDDKSDIKFITERTDKLWSTVADIEKTNEINSNGAFFSINTEFKEKLFEKIKAEVVQLEQKLNSSQVEESKRILQESKKISLQLKDELSGNISEVKRMSRENVASIEELRDNLLAQIRKQQELRQTHIISEKFEELHASLTEEMEQKIEKTMTQEGIKWKKLEGSSFTEKNQTEVEQFKKTLSEKLDKLEKRMDQVLQNVEVKLERIELQTARESSPPPSIISNPSNSINQFKTNDYRISMNPTTDGSKAEIKKQENEDVSEMATKQTIVGKRQLHMAFTLGDSMKELSINGNSKMNEKRINNSPKSKNHSPENPIIQHTLAQCMELQKTFRYCAKQINDTIKQLNLNDGEQKSELSDNESYTRPYNRCNYQRKKGINVSKFSRSQENIVDTDIEEIRSKDIESNSSIDRKDNYRLSGVQTELQSGKSRKKFSQSTPNLIQGPTCQCFKNKATSSKSNHRLHYDSEYNQFVRLNDNLLPRLNRTERKILSIKSSSNSLIQQIKNTSSQLRNELSSLQNLNAESKTPVFGPSELLIVNTTMGKIKDKSSSQPKIYIEDTLQNTDENLIKQLRCIRNTVNERLQRMSMAIEKQKTTLI